MHSQTDWLHIARKKTSFRSENPANREEQKLKYVHPRSIDDDSTRGPELQTQSTQLVSLSRLLQQTGQLQRNQLPLTKATIKVQPMEDVAPNRTVEIRPTYPSRYNSRRFCGSGSGSLDD